MKYWIINIEISSFFPKSKYTGLLNRLSLICYITVVIYSVIFILMTINKKENSFNEYWMMYLYLGGTMGFAFIIILLLIKNKLTFESYGK